MASLRVVIIDRPAWYRPVIEQEELVKVDGEVLVGWDRLGASKDLDPAAVARGQTVEQLSMVGPVWIPTHEHTEDTIFRMAHDADAIVVTRARVSASLMDRLPRLRVIGRPGIGFDIIDIDAATARGIAVFNAPGFCAREVADHTIMLMLCCARKVPMLYSAMRSGLVDASTASPIMASYEMTLGLVAFGEIAREVALRAKAFGFRIIASDPFVGQAVADPFGVTMVSLDELLAESDIVSVHAPLGKQTFHLLGEREFSMMKPNAYVVNTSRGPVIDESALVAALMSGRIAGAGLDVFEREPLSSDSPLLSMNNVILTPHTGGISDSSAIATKRRTMRNIANALTGEWPDTRDLINPQVKANLRRV